VSGCGDLKSALLSLHFSQQRLAAAWGGEKIFVGVLHLISL
jgi:hypothetical protein